MEIFGQVVAFGAPVVIAMAAMGLGDRLARAFAR